MLIGLESSPEYVGIEVLSPDDGDLAGGDLATVLRIRDDDVHGGCNEFAAVIPSVPKTDSTARCFEIPYEFTING